MNILSNILGGGGGGHASDLLGGSGGFGTAGSGRPQQQSPSETIDKLCDRLVHSTLHEDRRAAVLALKGLARDYQLEVGTKGMPILVHLLKSSEGDEDPEMTKAILDTLVYLCDANRYPGSGGSGNNDGSSNNRQAANLGLQFTEIFIKDSSNTAHLLQHTLRPNHHSDSPGGSGGSPVMMHAPDFHVVYATLELLKILVRNRRKMMQDCILTGCTTGVSALVDLLDERREVLRNEILLLLIDLTYQNTDLQKIIAFESVFERLFTIIEQEGDNDLIVVQDCFQLMVNLLDDNALNQNYYRESGLAGRLKPYLSVEGNSVKRLDSGTLLFTIPPNNRVPPTVWTEQKRRSTMMALSVLSILLGTSTGVQLSATSSAHAPTSQPSSSGMKSSVVASANPGLKANKDYLHNAGFFESLVGCALSDVVPDDVKTKAMRALACLMRDHEPTQRLFAKSTVRSDATFPPVQLFMCILSGCLNQNFYFNTAVNSAMMPGRQQAAAAAATVDDIGVRFGAFEVIKSFITGNADFKRVLLKMMGLPQDSSPVAQSVLSSNPQLMAGYSQQQDETPGSLLVNALLEWEYVRRKDPYRSWFAAVLVTYLIAEPEVSKAKDKEACLEIFLSDGDDLMPGNVSPTKSGGAARHGERLFAKIAYAAIACSKESLHAITANNPQTPLSPGQDWQLGLSGEGRILVAYMSLLAAWMAGAPRVVQAYLSDGINFSFLIERINASGSNAVPIVQGLSALVLGLCFEYNDDQVNGMTRAAIQSIIINRIGSEQFVQRLTYLKDHLVMLRTNVLAGQQIPLFDEMFVEMCVARGLIDYIVRNVVNPNALKMKQQEREAAHQQETVLNQYKSLITQQDEEISRLRKQLEAFKLGNGGVGSPVAATSANDANEWRAKYETLSQEMEDLLVCLAEQDLQVERYRKRLQALGEVLSDDEEDEDEGAGERQQQPAVAMARPPVQEPTAPTPPPPMVASVKSPPSQPAPQAFVPPPLPKPINATSQPPPPSSISRKQPETRHNESPIPFDRNLPQFI